MKSINRLLTAAAVALVSVQSAQSQPATLTVEVDKPGIKVAPTLWGIFFEDINCSADGGIYPERVRNRSLEDTDKPDY